MKKILIIFIIFLVGCTPTITTPDIEDKSRNDALGDCLSNIDETPGESYVQYQQDLCRLSVAKESRNKALCSGIDNENKKDECIKYFEELPFVEGTATKEDILDKCKCTNYCYGLKYNLKCVNENVKTPQQCQSFMGLHWDTSPYEGTKQYFEEAELKSCLRSLINRQKDLSFCEEFPEIYSTICEEIKQEEIAKEKARIASLTRHVMTEDKDEWIFPHNSLDEAHGIIEEWKKEGYKNFRIIECTWDEEFEVCIDHDNGCVEGDCTNIKLNRHLKDKMLGIDFYAKYPELLDRKVCDNPPEIYATICERILKNEAETEKVRLSVSTMHVMSDNKDIWIGDNLNNGKAIIEEWKKEGYKNFRIFVCNWDEEFEVCIDYNAVYDEGDQSGLECNRHLREMDLGSDFQEKYPNLLDKRFC